MRTTLDQSFLQFVKVVGGGGSSRCARHRLNFNDVFRLNILPTNIDEYTPGSPPRFDPETFKPEVIDEPLGTSFKPEIIDVPSGTAFEPEIIDEPSGTAFEPEVIDEPLGTSFKPEIIDVPSGTAFEPEIIDEPSGTAFEPEIIDDPPEPDVVMPDIRGGRIDDNLNDYTTIVPTETLT